MQLQDDGEWRPVAYASRAMSPTEQRYAQIEKEALGITWASERFADFIIGLEFHIETDHKPLVPLLSSKNLVPLTMRIDVLEKLHDAHQGITKCRERAKASVWWPGLSHQLEEVVKQCPTVIKEQVNPAECLIICVTKFSR